MSRQKSTTITVVIVVATFFFLLVLLSALSGSRGYSSYNEFPIIFFSFVLWAIIVLGCVLSALKALRTFATVLGLFLIGRPFAVLFAVQTQSALVFTIFLTAWTVLGGLLTRSAKGVYWSFHLSAWIVGLGLSAYTAMITPYYSEFPVWIWLLLSIGVSIVLGAQYQATIAFLSGFKWLRTIGSPQQPLPAQPLPQQQQPYQQGYQAERTYEEGGQVFPYPHQEQPQANYPRQAQPQPQQQ